MATQDKEMAVERSTIPAQSHPMTITGHHTIRPGRAVPVLHLSPESIAIIDQELQRWKGLGLDGDEISSANFDLPTPVKGILLRGADIVHKEFGVCILRGLDPSLYSAEDNLLLFLGLAGYIGDVRGVQNRKGDMIVHITDSLQWNVPHSKRHGIHTNGGLPFHNDMGADILALQVRQCAADGGHTYVAATQAILTKLAGFRPDVVDVLSRADWPLQVSSKPVQIVRAPLAQTHNGNVMFSLDPGRLGLHPSMTLPTDNDASPYLTPAQHEALSIMNQVAAEQRIRLDTQPGDLVFINNWAFVHARDPYTDSDHDAESRRHLVRLWLRNSKLGWDIPAAMRAPWEAAYGSEGLGNHSKASAAIRGNYPVDPAPEYTVPKYTSGSAAFLLE